MNRSIYRQVALDRLSSPEQLDQLLTITSSRIWIALAAVVALLLSVGIWSIEGRVVTTANGTGVIVRQGGVLNIVSNGAGVVLDVSVHPGMSVKANQVIATIAQPALMHQLQLLENARNEAVSNRDQNLKVNSDAARLKLEAVAHQRTNTEIHAKELQERARLFNQQIEVEQQLFAKGLVTNQQVLDIKQKLTAVNDEIANANAQLKQLDAEKFAVMEQPKAGNVELRVRVTELERQIAAAKEKLELAQNVTSPYQGEVLEVKVSPGSTVAEAQPVVSIQPRQQSLEFVAYVPSLLAKDVKAGMDAEIAPSNIKREEYGFIRGHIEYVADYPATQEAMMRNFANDALLHALSETGPVTEIRATLQADAATASGFAWSTSRGPNVFITSGTICNVDIVTRRERPITLLFPFLRTKLNS